MTEQRDYIVYLHYFPNKKRYIGITQQGAKGRWKNGNGYKGQLVYNAIEKYGWDNILHFILYRDLTEQEAKAKEIELIAKYKTTDRKYGYNVSAGGDDGTKLYGADNGNSHKIICINTGEIFDTVIEASKKYSIIESTIRSVCTGKYKSCTSPYVNEKLIWQYYEDYLIEPKDITNIDLTHKKGKLVKCIETGEIYESMIEASEKTGIQKTSISGVCRGKWKTAGGYHWEYASQ